MYSFVWWWTITTAIHIFTNKGDTNSKCNGILYHAVDICRHSGNNFWFRPRAKLRTDAKKSLITFLLLFKHHLPVLVTDNTWQFVMMTGTKANHKLLPQPVDSPNFRPLLRLSAVVDSPDAHWRQLFVDSRFQCEKKNFRKNYWR